MQAQKRLSLNTSLKNSRVFDEHSDDDEPLTFDKLVKQQKELRKRKMESPTKPAKIKPDPDMVSPRGVKFDLSSVKLERDDDNCISSAVAQMQLLTPVKTEDDDKAKVNLKSAKRSLLKQRNSPYAKDASPAYSTRSSTTSNVGKEDNLLQQLEKTKRKLHSDKRSAETDPEVLKRRQKQIDFGKNTVGYDNYLKVVPRQQRKFDDPMTPNKHRVYSRRGFDGLIKQWRLKLHKYDPEYLQES